MDMHLSLEQRAKNDRTSSLLVNYPKEMVAWQKFESSTFAFDFKLYKGFSKQTNAKADDSNS